MFRSSGPRSRRPATPVAPRTHQLARAESAVLQSVQLILATADPARRGHAARTERAIRRRRDVVEYLRLQGGEIRDASGSVNRHLRVALGAGPGLSRLLRAMEAEGRIQRDRRGSRTYAVLLTEGAPASAVHAPPAEPPDAPDFAAFVEALIDMLGKRLAVADPDDRARVERLERHRADLRRDLIEYRDFVAGSHGGDPAAVRAFCDEKLEHIGERAVEFEHHTGYRVDDAFTTGEREILLHLVQSVTTQPA